MPRSVSASYNDSIRTIEGIANFVILLRLKKLQNPQEIATLFLVQLESNGKTKSEPCLLDTLKQGPDLRKEDLSTALDFACTGGCRRRPFASAWLVPMVRCHRSSNRQVIEV